MNNKAMLISHIFVWVVVVIGGVLLLIFGYNSIGQFTKQSCLAKSTFFEKNLVPDIEYMYNLPGSVVEKKYVIPCDVDKIYVVDNADMNDPLINASLGDKQLIREEVNNTNHNMFFFKGDNFQKGINAGDISIEYPNYQCFELRSSNFNIFSTC